jgi:outer membrane receptor for ferrienterochelin and colicins
MPNIVLAQKVLFRAELKEKHTHKPIPYATVKITDINDNVNYATTNENGVVTFQIDNDFNITFSYVGYKTLSEDVSYSNYGQFFMEEDFVNLDNIVVTGTRTRKSLKDTPVLTQVVTAKEIERVGTSDIKDILENEIPGLEFNKEGYGSSVSIQGLSGKYVLFLIDGERIAGETGGNIDFSMINPDDIEQIEVIKGSGATLYGSNAVGGVINIITKKLKKKWTVDVALRYGGRYKKDFSDYDKDNVSDDYKRELYENLDLHNVNANTALGYKGKHIFTKTNINYKTLDGYEFENHNGSKLSSNGLKDYKITQKLGFDIKKVNFVLNGNYYNHHEYDFKKADKKHNFYQDVKFGAKSDFKLTDKLDFIISWSNDTYSKYDYREQKDEKDINYKQNFNSYKVLNNYIISDKNILTSGIEFIQERLGTKMFDEGGEIMLNRTSDDIVLFVQEDITFWNKLNIMTGFRLGYHSSYNTHFTPKISVKYTFGDFNIRGTYSKGFVSPTLKELYMNWDHMGMFRIIGNDQLKSEKSDYYSASLEYTSPGRGFNMSVTGYYTKIDNKISGYWTDNQEIYRYANIEDSESHGVNMLFKTKLKWGFSLKGSYAYTIIKEEREGYNFSDKSPHTFTTQLDYKYSKDRYSLNVNLSGKYRGVKNFYTFDNNVYTRHNYADYSIWKLTIRQTFGSNYGLTLGVNNIFDYKPIVYTFSSYTRPGRNYYLKVTYRL